MVDEAVEDGCCDGVVAEDGAPPTEVDVGGQDEAVVFVGVVDDVEEQVSAFGVGWGGSPVRRWQGF